jgi:hypothetical protein
MIAYNAAMIALKPYMRTERTLFEQAGGFIADAHTGVVGTDGSIHMIPLDILTYPVNLKKMWSMIENPVGIVFREAMDDWCLLIPENDTHKSWRILPVPKLTRAHDMHAARALAEKAIQCDFDIDDAVVREIGG